MATLRRSLRLVLLILVAFSVLRCGSGSSSSEDPAVPYRETLSIGTDSTEAPTHRLFSDPAHVAEGDGRLFVVDRGGTAIRVYEQDGSFLRSVGAAGNAPGEFRQITALTYHDGRLLVADRRQARITVLAPTGALQGTYQLPEVPKVTQIAPLPDGGYAVVGASAGHLVHVVDSTFSTVRARLVPEADVQATDHKLETVAVQFFPGHVAVPAPGRLVYAPALYGGTLYAYRRTSDTSWTQAGTYRGAAPPDPPATFGPVSQVDRVDLPITLQQGQYGVQFHALSWGLSSGADGTLTHAFSRDDGDAVELIVERFSPEGTALGTQRIDTASAPMALDVIEMGGDGTLYLSDTRDVPRLRCLTGERP
jgi:DNA-binding beta-propeller fold protein YncE